VKFFETIGRTVLRVLEEFGRVFQILGKVAGWTVRPPYDIPELFRQMVRVGYDSIPVVFLTTLFTGMVMALQTVEGFQRFHAESLVGSVVALSLTREPPRTAASSPPPTRCNAASLPAAPRFWKEATTRTMPRPISRRGRRKVGRTASLPPRCRAAAAKAAAARAVAARAAASPPVPAG
jgi:hypothetical protein